MLLSQLYGPHFMSIGKTERKSEQRFFTSLGFLVTVLAMVFVLLLVVSPQPKKNISVDSIDQKVVELSPAEKRRQKLRGRPAQTPAAPVQAVASSAPLKDGEAVAKAEPDSAAGDGAQGAGKEQGQKLSRAIALIDTGNPQEAQAILEAVLQEDPKNEQALVELGMIHLIDYRSPNAALPFLEDALKVNGSNKIVLSELVGIYEELGQTEQGLSFLTGLYETQHGNGPLSLGIGQILAGQGREADAIPYLEAAAESSDNDAEFVLPSLADAYSAAGNPEKAVSTYKRAIDQERLRIQGVSQSSPGDDDFTEDKLNSLEMDYARLLIRQGRFDEADEVLKSVSGRLPNDGGVAALQDQLNKKRSAG